ncbi:putative ribose 5-phosphate isomerase [Leptomonas pyrrhocoris]|uniref:Putative ribose 5-phosphate isomerase n=1 Tax=Leptomonas pyrrhocoris TaxID=157538 RepID=A0A0N0DZI5_LEPPY|nr:putative ribose 5-phosphate isomerase [Leptomonas pyrrhocoris]XP_015663682.1 putative ribose 5-phosphate isomerase [Leptomonas pyrrhocoris]XP_015663683.1 putative ribose 5-phosphate isomerase [Leptomonas pyrrhocoris]XP_015663684.1 putative ribose 5-phosphate isomerase [Leptomonas pyrrhocoris]KPA85242.1 putative ribose 5-phosphate isomerase [Leptomonas pyrrhocoris]KPA85243.1 putative ribose 5-phosphate isomerase [Leptomonas pyrrhocoris]KPA85244.1 putative ribose 5-phosphate isomerase [Lepto|eukprot:XP_015663681.1 putative ribose 5-phosphate isomerase [Leptomonas pyrrhocoris]
MPMRVAFSCDHAAVHVHNEVMEMIKSSGTATSVVYMGPDSEQSVDYPDFAAPVCEAIQKGEVDMGFLLCGTGIGMSIAANKYKGIRAALCHDHVTAFLCRNHNDANVVCIGERVCGLEVIRDIILTALTTEFSHGERHMSRLSKVKTIEEHQRC